MITIRAYANCDHTYIVWTADAPIDTCLGFRPLQVAVR